MIRHGTPESIAAAQHQVLCEVDREHGIARIVMNRPEKRNALSVPMRDRMTDLLHEIERDADIRVVIYEGRGGSFSSGAEINEDWGQRGKHKRFTVTHACRYHTQLTWGRLGFAQAIQRSSKVTIAKVQGYCAAAAYFLLASRCDIVVAADDAKFGALEASFMGPAGATASIHLARMLGTKGAKRVGYTGQPIDAQTAKAYGFVHSVSTLADLAAETERLALRIAERPAQLMLYLKARIRAGESHLNTNVPVITGLLSSHFIRRAADEHNFFDSVRKGGVKAALDEEKERAGLPGHRP